jgi:hypothetical protein
MSQDIETRLNELFGDSSTSSEDKIHRKKDFQKRSYSKSRSR